MKKACGHCHRSKAATTEFFGINRRNEDGLQRYCLTCSRAKDKKHYEASAARRRRLREATHNTRIRNLNYLWEYLTNHPCVDCGENNPVVLEFDHVRGVKKNRVSVLASRGAYSISVLQAEIDKCEVRCANCHRIKTAKQFGWYANLTAPSQEFSLPGPVAQLDKSARLLNGMSRVRVLPGSSLNHLGGIRITSGALRDAFGGVEVAAVGCRDDFGGCREPISVCRDAISKC
jgi:hypothetical protein